MKLTLKSFFQPNRFKIILLIISYTIIFTLQYFIHSLEFLKLGFPLVFYEKCNLEVFFYGKCIYNYWNISISFILDLFFWYSIACIIYLIYWINKK